MPASVLWLLSTSSDSPLTLLSGVPSCSPSSRRIAVGVTPLPIDVGVEHTDRCEGDVLRFFVDLGSLFSACSSSSP